MSKYKIKRNQKEVAKLPTAKMFKDENPFVKKISFFKHMNNNEGLIEFKSSYKGKHFEITDFSNAPFNNMTFADINEVGKQWIKKYGLALCKELLGTIRSKYASLPIPGAETTLDGDTLRTEAATEKETLVTQLREMLDQMSRKSLLEADKDEAEFLNEKLNKVPIPIFIG